MLNKKINSIPTTTDNKELGEQSFENLQKSINGFHRQINALLNSGFETDDNKFFEISAVASGQAFKLQIDLDNAVEAVCTIVYSGDDTEITKTYIDMLEIPERFEDVSKKTIQDALRKMGEGLADLTGLIMES